MHFEDLFRFFEFLKQKLFFEYDVWIKSTISFIQGIDKMHSALIKMKFIQEKGGGGGAGLFGPPLNPPLRFHKAMNRLTLIGCTGP